MTALSRVLLVAVFAFVLLILLVDTVNAAKVLPKQAALRRLGIRRRPHPTSYPTSQPTSQATIPKSHSPEYEAVDSPAISPVQPPSNGAPSEARGRFSIEFSYVNVKEEQKAAFELAKARWSSIIVGDLPSSMNMVPGSWCGFQVPVARTVDDLLIGVNIRKIDGINGVLGRAGPCALDDFGIPRFGVMEFDEDDVDRMISMGTFNNVILHEMGHILGIGTLWERFDLIDGRFSPVLYYDGAQGNIGNTEVGRTGRAFVEDDGGPGTQWSHWKEAPPLGYDSELMTGYVEPMGVKMPLSALTVRALRDIGYNTDLSKADPYIAPPFPPTGRRRLRNKNKVAMGADTIKGPLKIIPSHPKPGREDDFERHRQRFESRRRKLMDMSDIHEQVTP